MSVRPCLFLVDDDPLIIETLSIPLENRYRVRGFPSGELAEEAIAEENPSLILLDLNLPNKDGDYWLSRWQSKWPHIPIVFCSAETKISRVVDCLRKGAQDFISKPFHPSDLLLIVERVLSNSVAGGKAPSSSSTMIGDSPAFAELKEKISFLRTQYHLNVLILGETGTGKELVAQSLHQQEENPSRPWVVVNMPAIPVSLMESELFGVEKGAFTDAKLSRAGKFELADGGDVFLDEIGDLPVETQAKMLRVLQERCVERIGSSRIKKSHFRAISATNRPLSELTSERKFREDLLFRLSDMVLWVPPLRERLGDIPLLANHFLAKYSPLTNLSLSETALDTLLAYHWPGNVRQLESSIKRACVFAKGKTIENVELFDLSTLRPRLDGTASGLTDQVSRNERSLLEEALRKYQGNKVRAMEELKLPRTTFYRKLQELEIR